ncbi:hypothetical protein Tco_1203937, partial [Tanacetum coccineum]
DDEEVLADKELSDLGETYVNEEDEIAKIFRIETNIFDFETPLCEAFNKFSYLLKIDTDLLTHDIHGFKHMKNTKMHGSMNGMKSCHGFLKKHGWRMEYLVKYLTTIAYCFTLKMDMWSGPLVIQMMMDIVTEETYQE